jgi:hypothetical protein
MRVIKLFFLSLLFFFVLITAMSLLVPGHIRLSKAINIGSPADSILHLIRNREAWKQWHPAFAMAGSDSLLAKHEVTIVPVLQTDTLVQVRWQQPGKNPVLNSWQLHQFPASDSITLQWYMDFRLQWHPWQKFSSLFYENTYGNMMQQGLRNIKTITEKTDQE